MLCAIIILLVFEGSGIFDFASKFVARKRGARRRKSGEGRKGGRGCIVLSWLSASKWPPSISDAKWPRTKRLGSPRCAKWRVDGLDSLLSFHSLACRFLGRMKKEGESSMWKKIEIIENWLLKIICIWREIFQQSLFSLIRCKSWKNRIDERRWENFWSQSFLLRCFFV